MMLFSILLLPIQNIASNEIDSLSLKNEIIFSLNNPYNGSMGIKYARIFSNSKAMKFGINYLANIEEANPIMPTTYASNTFHHQLSVFAGLDKHKQIQNKYEIITGFNLIFIDNFQRTRIDNPRLTEEQKVSSNHELNYGMGFTFGIYYNFSRHFSIGSEYIPTILHTYQKHSNIEYRVVLFNLTNLALINFRYKI